MRVRGNTRFTLRREDAAMQRRLFLLCGGALWSSRSAAAQDQAWTDAARGRTVPLRLRWPEGSGPCALILHSHGLGGNREGGDRWGQAWQAAGFVVLHLQRPGSDSETLRSDGIRGLRAAASAEQLRARVADAHFVIDEVLRRAARGDSPWARVRRDAIGVSGHSFGAHTVQALAGQRFPVAAEGAADARIRAFVAFSPSLGASRLSPQDQFSRVTRGRSWPSPDRTTTIPWAATRPAPTVRVFTTDCPPASERCCGSTAPTMPPLAATANAVPLG